MIKYIIIFFLFSGIIWGQTRDFADKIEFPEKINEYKIEIGLGVYDFDEVFNNEEKQNLNKYLEEYYYQTNRTISIITFDSISPYVDFINMLTDLGNSIDANPEGFMIGISRTDRKVAITPTLLSEKDLTQPKLDNAVFEILIPHFKNEKYYTGVLLAIEYLTDQFKD
jgi:uncharacterized protein